MITTGLIGNDNVTIEIPEEQEIQDYVIIGDINIKQITWMRGSIEAYGMKGPKAILKDLKQLNAKEQSRHVKWRQKKSFQYLIFLKKNAMNQ